MAEVIVPVVVVGTYLDNNGYAQTGEVRFDMLSMIQETPARFMSAAHQIVAKLDASGSIAVPILALAQTDSTVISGLSSYVVRELIDGATMDIMDAIVITPFGLDRVVHDGVLVADSTTFTSATAAFTADDVGTYVGSLLVPPLTTIASVQSPTSVTLSAPSSTTGSGLTIVINSSVNMAQLGGGG